MFCSYERKKKWHPFNSSAHGIISSVIYCVSLFVVAWHRTPCHDDLCSTIDSTSLRNESYSQKQFHFIISFLLEKKMLLSMNIMYVYGVTLHWCGANEWSSKRWLSVQFGSQLVDWWPRCSVESVYDINMFNPCSCGCKFKDKSLIIRDLLDNPLAERTGFPLQQISFNEYPLFFVIKCIRIEIVWTRIQ